MVSKRALEKNIKTIAYKKSGGSKLLKTLSPKEYIKKLTKKEKRGQAWARFGESMNNFNSGKKTAHTKFNNGSVYGGGGTGLSATTTIDDPDARKRANRESEQRLANMASIRNSIIQNANQSLLKANTMSYGEMTGGRVVINSESPYGEKYNFRIAIGSDIHKIIFVKE